MNIRDRWATGIQEEIDFWRGLFAGKRPDYWQAMQQRLDPRTPVMPYIAARLPADVSTAATRILDVGAGPVSCVGWHVDGHKPQLTAIDALAPQYRMLLDEFGLRPPVYTRHCDGEHIGDAFTAEHFNLVHIRNALDHCYDPLRVVENMLTVLKPGGTLMILVAADEAEFQHYSGLHQWNVRAEAGHLIIWRPGERHDVNRLLADRLDAVEVAPARDDAPRRTSVVLRKRAAQ